MTSPAGRVVQHLRWIVEQGNALRDRDLLIAFATTGDESAFAALVRRHGPMVLGVCRRILQCQHDAEDAFQATFLVLARRAASIRQPDCLASWLYEVAFRLARKMKVDSSKRRAREDKATPPGTVAPPDPSWREMQSVLDEELRELPEKHRQPLLLCYLQGLTQEEAADQLGCPRGTLKRRLERGRELLKTRLSRRGLTLAGTLAATLPAGDALAHAVPAALGAGTVQAAREVALTGTLQIGAASSRVVALAEGLMRTMFRVKLKVLMAATLAGALFTWGAMLCMQDERVAPPMPTVQPVALASPAAVQVDKNHPLKIAFDVPEKDPTVRQVNGGKYLIVVRVHNTTDEELTLWPHLSIRVLDSRGQELPPKMALGRFGLRTDDKSVLERFHFAKIKAGEALKVDVNIAMYVNDAETLFGWQLPGEGKYTLQVHYKYDRVAAKKRYGQDCLDIEGAAKPWNKAVQADLKADTAFRVTGDEPEMPTVRQHCPPSRHMPMDREVIAEGEERERMGCQPLEPGV